MCAENVNALYYSTFRLPTLLLLPPHNNLAPSNHSVIQIILLQHLLEASHYAVRSYLILSCKLKNSNFLSCALLVILLFLSSGRSILESRKFSAYGKGFNDLLPRLSNMVEALNIGDFIPYLGWMDLQGIKRRMKAASKTYDAFAEKIIDDHLHARNGMAAEPEAEAEQVKDFVDVLLQMEAEQSHIKGDAKTTRETIKSIILVCRSGLHYFICKYFIVIH